VNLTGVCLTPQEVVLLRQMSETFVNAMRSDDPADPAPFDSGMSEDDSAEVSDKILRVFRARAENNRRNS